MSDPLVRSRHQLHLIMNGAYPDFLLRGTRNFHVSGFLSKKAAWNLPAPPRSTGNLGEWDIYKSQ
jgi:hypothetical protein